MARSSEAMSFGTNFCTVGSFDHGEPVGNQMRGGEHVAQIVAHFAHREAERGEMRFLLQQCGEFGLHRRASSRSATPISSRAPRAR